MILAKKKFNDQDACSDEVGRWVACKLNVEGAQIGLICAYAPNVERDKRRLWEELVNVELGSPIAVQRRLELCRRMLCHRNGRPGRINLMYWIYLQLRAAVSYRTLFGATDIIIRRHMLLGDLIESMCLNRALGWAVILKGGCFIDIVCLIMCLFEVEQRTSSIQVQCILLEEYRYFANR